MDSLQCEVLPNALNKQLLRVAPTIAAVTCPKALYPKPPQILTDATFPRTDVTELPPITLLMEQSFCSVSWQ